MGFLIDYVPYVRNVETRNVRVILKAVKTLSFLLKNCIAAINAYEKKLFYLFDPQVSENLCQIRAFQNFFLFESGCENFCEELLERKIRWFPAILIGMNKKNKKPIDFESYLTFRNFINIVPGHVYWLDTEGRYLGCNIQHAKHAQLNGPSEIIGKKNSELPWKQDADSIDAINKKIIENGKLETIEEKNITPDGAEEAYLSKKTPIKNENGEIIGLLGISFDITELKRTQQRLEDSKAREAHFKALSAISGMMAHELRTPLGGLQVGLVTLNEFILSLLDDFKRWLSNQPGQELQLQMLDQVKPLFERMQRSVQYANTTISTVLEGFHENISHLKPKLEVFPLRLAIEEAKEIYPQASQAPSDLRVKVPDLKIHGNIHILVFTVINLLKNAYHAIQENGSGRIQVSLQKNDDKCVLLIVEDNATGIDPSILPHIFEPFFTTKKETAASIGLGLYFCQLSLKKMDADIYCKSELGKYTRFFIKLPLAGKEE